MLGLDGRLLQYGLANSICSEGHHVLARRVAGPEAQIDINVISFDNRADAD